MSKIIVIIVILIMYQATYADSLSGNIINYLSNEGEDSVLVYLMSSTLAVIDSAYTDSNGDYSFTGLAAGSYF
jgi:hypothetical protein